MGGQRNRDSYSRSIVHAMHAQSNSSRTGSGAGVVSAHDQRDLPNGAEGNRTLNLSIANAALSQLSYRPGRWVILLGVTQLVDECIESPPIAPEYGQDGTCAARPISSISCTKTVQLRNSFSTCLTP